jgi:hypothetical protein
MTIDEDAEILKISEFRVYGVALMAQRKPIFRSFPGGSLLLRKAVLA